MQPHSEATAPAQRTPADLADTVRPTQNPLPIANRIPKSPVVLNAAADRRDRPCHGKMMGSTETTLKCLKEELKLWTCPVTGDEARGSVWPCSGVRIRRRCAPD